MNYLKEIEENLNDIDKLVETPKLIGNIVLTVLNDFGDDDLTNIGIGKVKNVKDLINNIEEKNFEKEFKIIYNQVCVLAVSVLSATIEKYFINFSSSNWQKINYENSKVKFLLKDLAKYDFEVKTNLGKMILDKDNSINFQDLQSILRLFKEYFDKDIIIDKKITKNIVFFQQCRHVIVHKNSIVDYEFIKKVKKANIKKYKEGDRIELAKNDWVEIKTSFKKLIEVITNTPNRRK